MRKWIVLALSAFVALLAWRWPDEKSNSIIADKQEAQSQEVFIKPVKKQEPVIQPPPPPSIEENLQPSVGASPYPEGLKPLHQTTTADGNYELAFLGPENFGPTHIDGLPYTNNGKIVPATIEIGGSIIDADNEKHTFLMDVGPQLISRNDQVMLWLRNARTQQIQTEIALFLGSLEVGMAYEVEIFSTPLSVAGIRSAGEIVLFKEKSVPRQIGSLGGGSRTAPSAQR